MAWQDKFEAILISKMQERILVIRLLLQKNMLRKHARSVFVLHNVSQLYN